MESSCAASSRAVTLDVSLSASGEHCTNAPVLCVAVWAFPLSIYWNNAAVMSPFSS